MFKIINNCWIFAATGIFFLGVNLAGAQPVSVVPAPWSPSVHAEDSYADFEIFLSKKQPKQKLGSGDFYSSVNIVPQLTPIAGACSTAAPWFIKALHGLFGNSATAMVVVTMSATAGQGRLGQYDFLTNVPLFYAGKGIDPSTNTASPNGCFFDYLPTLREPFIRFDGGSNEGYTLTFEIRQSKTLSVGAVATLRDALQAIVSGIEIVKPGVTVGPTDAQTTAFANAGNDLQSLINSSLSGTTRAPITKYLMTNGSKNLAYHLLSSFQPNSTGNIAIYARLSSSLILDTIGDDIDYEKILTNDIGEVPCIPSLPTPNANCVVKSETFLDAYKAHVTTMAPEFFDLSSDAGMKNVFNTCDDLRLFSTGTLKLSTLDALLVRWAAVKDGRLDVALADPAKRALIAKDSSVTPADLDRCWNTTDQDTLNGIATIMHKTIEGAAPH
jgi:hypothetical protein